MTAYMYMVSSLFLIAATVIAWVILKVARQITYVTLADGRRLERSLPILLRLMLPFAAVVPGFITRSRFLKESRERLNQKLITSGYEGLIEPHEIIALRLLMPLILGAVFSILLAMAIPQMSASAAQALAGRQSVIDLVVVLLLAVYPDLWLRNAIKKRHKSIERELPFVLDLLTLSVESGLDFLSGVQRIINSREIDPLGEELIRIFREIQVGRSRKVALQGFATRVNHTDVRTLASALIQADELGTGVASALRIQSNQIRTKRFQRAEKLGNEAPVKMLFPLVAFIFPSVFLILIGPIVLQMIVRSGF